MVSKWVKTELQTLADKCQASDNDSDKLVAVVLLATLGSAMSGDIESLVEACEAYAGGAIERITKIVAGYKHT